MTDVGAHSVFIVGHFVYICILHITSPTIRYETSTGRRKGFTARPVIGGLFARILTHGPYGTQPNLYFHKPDM